MLREKGVDYNLQDENGYSALHHAALKDNYEGAAQLVKLPSINVEVSSI
jgi:ankyrin repeat protein